MGHLLFPPYSIKTSPGAAIFGRDMLFDIPFIADWKEIGEHRQRLTDLNTAALNMAESVNTSDINIFLADAAWAICSTHHTVLKASPGAAIFG